MKRVPPPPPLDYHAFSELLSACLIFYCNAADLGDEQ